MSGRKRKATKPVQFDTCNKDDTLSVIETKEVKRLKRDQRLAGLPEHWTRKDLVKRAIKGDPILDVSPEDAALREHFAEQLGMVDPELVSFYPTQQEQLEEREENFEIYASMDLLGKIPDTKPTDGLNYDKEQDDDLLRVLYSGYADLSHGIRRMGRGFDKVRAVLAKRPNLENLHKVFAKFLPAMPTTQENWQVMPYTPASKVSPPQPVISKAKIGDREFVVPQVYVPGNYSQPSNFTEELMKPMVTGDEPKSFKCRVCEVAPFKSWGKCDGHIRESHRGWKFGPCPQCDMFYSWSRDSFIRHMKVSCSKRAKAEHAAPTP